MGTLVWLALAFFVVVLAVGPWFAFHHGLRTFRASMRTLERLGDELEATAAKLEEAAPHLDEAAAAGERLTAALDRLSRSRARLNILVGAFSEVRTSVNGVLAFVPRGK